MIKNILRNPYLSLILRIYIGIIFIYASLSKIYYPGEFAEAIAAYQLVPFWAVNLISVYLPWLELICGTFLIFGLFTRTVASILGILLIIFIFAILINLIRGNPISCGCFENIDYEISWRDVIRDTIWLLFIFQIFFFDRVNLLRKNLVTITQRIKNK